MGKSLSKKSSAENNGKHHQQSTNGYNEKSKTKYSRSWKKKQYLKQVKRDKKAQHLTEDQMYKLSQELTRTAWYLGRRLEMSEATVRRILWNEPNEQAAKFSILMQWRKQIGWRATNQNLVILLELAGYTYDEYKNILPQQSNGQAPIYDKVNETNKRKPSGYFRYDDFDDVSMNKEKQSSMNDSADHILDFARRSWKKPSRREQENEKPSSTRALENEKSRKRKSRNENLNPRKPSEQRSDVSVPHSAREESTRQSSGNDIRVRRYSDSTVKHVTPVKSDSESELKAILKRDENMNMKSDQDHLIEYKKEILRMSKRQYGSYPIKEASQACNSRHQKRIENSSQNQRLTSNSVHKFSLIRTSSYEGIYNFDQQISGLAVSKDNEIVLAESNNKEIQIFDRYGEFLRSFPTQSDLNPKGIGFNKDGNIIICCGKEVRIFSTEGDVVRVFGQGSFRNNCYSVECDAIGTYYVSDIVGHSISVFDTNGGIRKRFGNLGEKLNNFNQPVALAINEQNKLFISDSQNHCVKVYSLAGRPLEQIGEKGSDDGQFWNPFGITLDRRGHLLVADCGNNRISLFDKRTYKFLHHVLTDKDGLHMPSFITVNSTGQLLVCEWNRPHVKIYSFESAV